MSRADGKPNAYRVCEVALLREAFLRSGLTAAEVAHALGWYAVSGQGYVYADGGRVRRALGLRPEPPSRRYGRKLRVTCRYDLAVRLAHAIGVDPVEVGL